ncbi:MAG: restriction endonuclease subunit S [Lachnospiraceae bacterium]|nr:restriction endonuclease subunit S [Lachnospiraceae bacterium]
MTAHDLKNSILQLAMQGKLVGQKLEEGTARELMEHSKFYGKGKAIKDDEKPYDIPNSWCWVRLVDIGDIVGGGTPKTSESSFWENGDIPWLTPADIRGLGKYVSCGERKITQAGLNNSSARLMPKGTVIYSSRAPIGYIGIALNELCTNQGFKSLVPFDIELSEYLYYCLIARTQNIISRASGTTFKEISGNEFGQTIIPIPPLGEQKRIVKKIEELLPYIEKYDMVYSKLETYDKKFPEDMQKSILQYAMQGKLVKQRPEEGTGEELYWQIQAEKEKLIKEGKIKKEKSLPGISEDEIPFDVPDTWAWVKVGDLFTVIRGSSPRPKGSPLYWSDKKTDYSWITIKDISLFCKDGVLSQTTEYLTEAGADLSTYVEADELIIAVSGSTTGKHCVLGIDGYIYDGLAAILNPTKIISSSYLLLFFDWVYDRLNAQKVGSAFPNINTDILKNTLMPLPPLGEQERIIVAMKSIMPCCKRLRKD